MNPKLNKNKFRAIKFENKGNDREYWLAKRPIERLEAAWYLACCAFNIPFNANLKLDRTKFKGSKRNE